MALRSGTNLTQEGLPRHRGINAPAEERLARVSGVLDDDGLDVGGREPDRRQYLIQEIVRRGRSCERYSLAAEFLNRADVVNCEVDPIAGTTRSGFLIGVAAVPTS